MSPTTLVTGATGLVGGALVLELLRESDRAVVCLVREPADGRSAEAKLRAALAEAAWAYGEVELLRAEGRRVTALAGDVTLPGCGVDDAVLPEVDEVWHSAASLAYEQDAEDETMRINVDGTRAVVELAERAGAESLAFMSTAYVGGARTGRILEEVPPLDTPSNNSYERSKLAAEHVVVGARVPRVLIVRPTIVVGHSTTCGATTFTGLYGFVRALRRLKEEVDDVLGDLLARRPLRLRGDPDVPLNFIPVDVLARTAVAIARSGTDARVFHVANTRPPTVDETIGTILTELGLRPPRWVDSPEAFTSIDRQVDDRIEFYRSYIRDTKLFDRSNTDAAAPHEPGEHPMPIERIQALIRWYLWRRQRARDRAREPVSVEGV